LSQISFSFISARISSKAAMIYLYQSDSPCC